MTRPVNTRAIRARNRRILDASDVCHLCGHPGADAVDHVIPLARGGSNAPTNLRPAHHTNPCPTCGIMCNRVKGDKLVAPIIRRSGTLTRPQGDQPPPPPHPATSAHRALSHTERWALSG